MTRYLTEDVFWFAFNKLCASPSGAADYIIELASQYHVVLISAVPVSNRIDDEQAQLSIMLMDQLNDQKVKLVLHAAVPVDQLSKGLLWHLPSNVPTVESPKYSLQDTLPSPPGRRLMPSCPTKGLEGLVSAGVAE